MKNQITKSNNPSLLSSLWDKKDLLLVKEDIYPKKIIVSFIEMAERLQELKIPFSLSGSSVDNNIKLLKSFGIPVIKVALKKGDRFYEEIKPQDGFLISYIENPENSNIEYTISKVK